MATLTEVPLGPSGLRYVESCLKHGSGLCSKLLEVVASGGTVFTPVPDGTSLTRAEAFEVGGLMFRQDMKTWLVKHLDGLRSQAPEGCVIFQDVWAKSSDPVIKVSESESFFYDSGVYYFVDAAHLDARRVEKAVNDVTSYLLVGVFTGSPVVSSGLPANRDVDEASIDDLAQNTIEIFVSAYDQEGIVVWRRNSGDTALY